MSWVVKFYRTRAGRSPVEDYLDSLDAQEVAKATRGLELLRTFGNELGMPHARPIRGGLHELRVRGRREHRIVYIAVVGRTLLLLHAFTKKTPQTPAADIALAEQRFRDYLDR